MPTVGRKAPAFTLPDQDGKSVRLSDLRDRWVVLYFYPRDNTSGCTKEACEFTASIAAFRRMEATVVGVSPDPPETHQRFIRQHKLKVTLLSDPGHQMMRKYSAWGKKVMYGKAVQGVIRSTVLIDPTGKVAHHWPRVKAAGHAQQVRTKLLELRKGD